jgi:hypothetical protein
MVRTASSEPWMIKRVLDAGAHAIMVPMCETKVCAGERPATLLSETDQTTYTGASRGHRAGGQVSIE